MNIKYNIKATNMELTDAIRAYVESKLAAIEKLVNPKDTSVYATVEVGKTTKHHKQGNIFRAEINIHIAGRDLRATSKREDLYAAIDEAKDEVIRRLRKVKTRRTDVVRRSAARMKKMFTNIRTNEDE